MPDRGDYQETTEVTVPIIVTLDHGADANKSATPVAGESYLATDTKIFYVCFIDGTWVAVYSP
jgi:hypothetical protein